VKVSICEFTTVGASFEEDLAAYAAAGVDGIGVCEFKLGPDEALCVSIRRLAELEHTIAASLWDVEPGELARRARESLERVWEAR
jgi:hypothetical protein